MRRRLGVLTLAASAIVLASLGWRVEGQTSLHDLPARAIERSQITLLSSPPFHLRATVFEATNRGNDSYDADIEEDWAAPDKWRRTVKTAKFSETLTTNGDKVSAQIDGDYYPHWLRTLADAIFDPGAPLQGVDLTKSSDNPVISRRGSAETCRRFGYRVGIAPATNTIFASYCFQDGLLERVVKPGYDVDYGAYRKFGKQRVARKIHEEIESGTTLEADIIELNESAALDDSLFKVDRASGPLRTIGVTEQTLRAVALSPPDIQWPTIKDGKPVGRLSVYVCVDRQGSVREIYALNSDNPYMTDAASKQVMAWKFKPASNSGEPVQIEGILTFAYQTEIDSRGRSRHH
ncbi:MAG TPA: energy transducer TonB [Candidatus Acidoferrales bacterium]|nr:energy transducer TonB [Candidatus Acidoferrales bacterium]